MKLEKTPAGPGWAGRNPGFGAVGLPGSSLCGHAKPQPCVVEVCGGTGPFPQTWAPRPAGPAPLPQHEPKVENPDRGRLLGRGNGPGGPRACRGGGEGKEGIELPLEGFPLTEHLMCAGTDVSTTTLALSRPRPSRCPETKAQRTRRLPRAPQLTSSCTGLNPALPAPKSTLFPRGPPASPFPSCAGGQRRGRTPAPSPRNMCARKCGRAHQRGRAWSRVPVGPSHCPPPGPASAERGGQLPAAHPRAGSSPCS